MGSRAILHSDMNAFYASVEMMLNPELRDKAVAVCGATETRHGIVLAKSERAKQAGVKTGMVNWEAERLCPGLVLVPPHFEQYHKYSRLAREIYQRYTDFVEPYGMDECFLDVTGSANVYGDGAEIAQKIRRTVKAELGLTVSVGVSFNKVFAKLGSDLKKPDAVTKITEETFRSQVWPLPVSTLFFVGRASSAKLLRYGIKTIGQLAALPPEFMQQVFGKNGLLLWSYANGLDSAPVMQKDYTAPPKSIGHGITCTADLESAEEVWRVLLELSQDIGHKLNAQGLKASGVQISVKDNALVSRQFQSRLPYPVVSASEIALRARQLFDGNYDWRCPVRALTVRAFELRAKDEPEQMDLFAELEKRERREQLRGCVEDVRRRFGKRALYSAALMGNFKLPDYRDHELILPGAMKR